MWWDYWPMHPFFFGPLFMIAIFAICMVMMMWMMRSGGGGRALDILNDGGREPTCGRPTQDPSRRT